MHFYIFPNSLFTMNILVVFQNTLITLFYFQYFNQWKNKAWSKLPECLNRPMKFVTKDGPGIYISKFLGLHGTSTLNAIVFWMFGPRNSTVKSSFPSHWKLHLPLDCPSFPLQDAVFWVHLQEKCVLVSLVHNICWLCCCWEKLQHGCCSLGNKMLLLVEKKKSFYLEKKRIFSVRSTP